MSTVELNPIEKAYHTVKESIDNAYDAVGKFLDDNPTIYKMVLIASHFFRAIPMFALMECVPLPWPVTAAAVVGGSIGGTLMYRAAVERFCCFRFAIPSMIGGGVAWLAKIAIVNFISGAALSSLGMTIANSLLFIPMLCYTAWVIYLAHEDIEKRMEMLGNSLPDKNAHPQQGASCHIPQELPVKKSCCHSMV